MSDYLKAKKELQKGLIYRHRKNNKLVEEFINLSFEGSLTKIKTTLQKGVNINAIGSNGEAAIHKACRSQKILVVRFLLDMEAAPNIKEEERGLTPLMNAIEVRNLQLVQLLIEAGANVNARNYQGVTPIIMAIQKSLPLELIKILIGAGADLEAKDYSGMTVIMHAAYMNDLMPILMAGISKLVNKETLFKSICANNSKNVQKFIEAGLDLANNKTQEYICLFEQKTSVLKTGFNRKYYANLIINFIQENASIEGFDKVLLLQGSEAGDIERVSFLIEAGIDVNIRGFDNITPLIEATRAGQIEIIKILLEAGADVNLRDRFERTALDYIEMKNYRCSLDKLTDIGLLLLSAGAKYGYELID
ncbi:MAG: ankyrin repeat domain-containing protein [Oscillatoria sp. PMC 1051.18]|nr:ankyrin repeat domain-containing protein [Oscillatoria sp. PMC 1050.18]MEC5032981.1 ankyrin repeat domain-containing protein [Oscillatoria sp. PMC 1051.18]